MTGPTITTKATGRREEVPDLASVDIVVTGTGESAAVARGAARDHAATIRDALTSVSTDQVRVVDRYIRTDSDVFDPEFKGQYQATERLQVDCVAETADAVVVESTDAGGTVRTVEFHLHEEIYRRLQNEALSEAMARSREKAEQLAAAEGLHVAEVRSVTTTDVEPGMESIVDEALGQNTNTKLQPSPITVSQRVEVVYTLTTE